MTRPPEEPPLEIELAEMIQQAAEVDDPIVYKIIDIQIAKMMERSRERRAALNGIRERWGLEPLTDPTA